MFPVRNCIALTRHSLALWSDAIFVSLFLLFAPRATIWVAAEMKLYLFDDLTCVIFMDTLYAHWLQTLLTICILKVSINETWNVNDFQAQACFYDLEVNSAIIVHVEKIQVLNCDIAQICD